MKKLSFLLLITFYQITLAQQNLIYKYENPIIRIGGYTYTLNYQYSYSPEDKVCYYNRILKKGNKMQFLGNFRYQLKSSMEMQISPDNPPPKKIENKILSDSYFDIDEEKKQIILKTYYYNDETQMEIDKEIETEIYQQGKIGFFYLLEKQTKYKNGEIKIEKKSSKEIIFYKTPSYLLD